MTCPLCQHDVTVRDDGRLANHKSDLMRWSGRRWFRTTCRGSGRLIIETGP